MKSGKLISIFTAAAVTASCVAGMLAFNASAEYSPASVLVTSESGNKMTLTSYLSTVAGRKSKRIYQKIDYDTDSNTFAVRLTKSDLIAMRDDTICKEYEFLITDEHEFSYYAVIGQDDIPADSSLIPEQGISLALSAVPGSYEVVTKNSEKVAVKCIDIKGTGSFGGVSVKYSFSGSYLKNLTGSDFSAANMVINCLMPYKDKDGNLKYSLESTLKTIHDASFTLTGSTKNLRRFAYDPYSEYYKKSSAAKVITEILGKITGYSEEEMTTYSSVLKNAQTNIAGTLTNEYYSREELTDIVKAYVNDSNNLKALISDMLREDSDQKAIYEAVYSVFGEQTSSYQADNIVEFIRNDLVDKLYYEIIKEDSYIKESYSGRIKFFLNQYANEILTDLKNKVTAMQKQLGTDPQNIIPILDKLAETKPDTGRQEQTAQTTQTTQTAGADKSAYEMAVANGFKGTITEWFNMLAENRSYLLAVEKGYTGTPDLWISSLTGNSGKAAYEYAVANGFRGSLAEWTDILTGTVSKEETKNTTSTDQNTKEIQDFYNWAIERYGSIEGFMAAVADLVLKDVNNGESAYEIAVRNGFVGTEQEWLRSLKGESAYEIAVRNGFVGTEKEWLESLRGKDGKDGQDAEGGDENRVIYMYGYSQQGASANQTAADDGEITIDNSDADDTKVTVISGDEKPAAASAGNTGPVAGNTTTGSTTYTAGKTRAANPATGTAAAVLIPAAAGACLLLLKKDKRRRGRR